MKQELELVRSARAPRDESLSPRAQPTAGARKTIREVTDAVIEHSHDLVALTKTLAATMLVTAEVLDDFELEPDVYDFVEAAKLLVAASRTVLDRGLLLTAWPQAKHGAVMLELTVRGICAALGVPYDEVLREVHAAGVEGYEVDIAPILLRAGLLKTEETQP